MKKSSQLLASILINAIYAMKNFPITLINTILSPLSFLLIIYFASRGILLPVAIEGGFIMSMVSAGIGLQGDLSHLKNDFKFQDMVVSSPTTPSIYILGMAISELVYSIPALTVLTILAIIYINASIFSIITIIFSLLLIFFFSIMLGFYLSTLTSDIIQSWAFSGIVSTVLSTIPPVYYPITYIPLPYRYIAYLSPTTYVAEIVQNATGYLNISFLNLILDWTVLIILIIILAIVSIKKSRWREK